MILHLVKHFALKLANFLALLSPITIVCSNFSATYHIAIPNIALATGIAASILVMILNKEVKFNLSPKIFIFSIGFVAIYFIACIINNETSNTIIDQIRYRSIIIGYTILIFIMPKLNANQIRMVLWAFALTVFILEIVFCRNYYIYAILEKGKSFYNPEWRFSMDRITMYISPFKILNHAFSIYAFMSIGFLYYVYQTTNIKIEKIASIFFITISIIFIHFMGSRIGLFCLYSTSIYMLYKTNSISITYKLTILGLMILIAVASFEYVPTFRDKILRTSSEFNDGVLYNGAANRMFSYKVGIDIVREHFWKGVSLGKTNSFFVEYYKLHYPNLKEYDYARPHNQFLFNAALWGVPLTILFIIIMYCPLFISKISFLLGSFYYGITIYMLFDMPFSLRECFFVIAFFIPFLVYIQTQIKINRNNIFSQ